jgi:hypothetical protein
MPVQLQVGPIHDLRLTVADIPAQSRVLHRPARLPGSRGVSTGRRPVGRFDERGVPHGEIRRLQGFGIDILPFRDPDTIALELTAPVGGGG